MALILQGLKGGASPARETFQKSHRLLAAAEAIWTNWQVSVVEIASEPTTLAIQRPLTTGLQERASRQAGQQAVQLCSTTESAISRSTVSRWIHALKSHRRPHMRMMQHSTVKACAFELIIDVLGTDAGSPVKGCRCDVFTPA